MYLPMIDHDEAIAKFQQLLEPRSRYRFLRLSGEGKMGKTKLMSEVFPTLAAHKSVACVLLDLRDSGPPLVERMHSACHHLLTYFPNFCQTYAEVLSTPNVGVELTSILAILSFINIKNQLDAEESARRNLSRLTFEFVKDLEARQDLNIVLLFDTVDKAHPTTQSWLMDTLLVYLCRLEHVRVVVAGSRSQLPEAASSYAQDCHNYELGVVTDIEAYIRYCHTIGCTLSEDNIRRLAKNLGYNPGSFAEYVKQ